MVDILNRMSINIRRKIYDNPGIENNYNRNI